jgi:putative DNA primase/helicase
LFGDYAYKIDVEALMLSANRGQSASPYVAGLKGARFVFGTEIPESRRLDEALIKDITGGDVITARYLFGNPFIFQPTHKLWLFGNHKPKIIGTDLGVWRRIRVIPFQVTIPDEQQKPMSEVLAEFDQEMSGILTWAVSGCLLWQNNKMDTVTAVEEATREYKSEQDLVQQFIDESCEKHPDYSEAKDRMYTAWRAWCERSGEESAKNRSRKWFTQQMTGHGCSAGGHGRSDIVGIKLK